MGHAVLSFYIFNDTDSFPSEVNPKFKMNLILEKTSTVLFKLEKGITDHERWYAAPAEPQS